MRKLRLWMLGVLALPFVQSAAFGQCQNLSTAVAGNSILNTASTAFATQSSAFTGGPSGTLPDQPGGGLWARAVGGHVGDGATGTINEPGIGTINCNATFYSNFEGIQAGADVARFNLGGGRTNVYLGVTGGYLAAHGHDNANAMTADFSLPFVGVYGAMTNGGFFGDVLYRHDFFSGNLTVPGIGVFNEGMSGADDSVTASAGYQIPVGQSSFIEPSGAFVWANFHVNPLNIPGAGPVTPGTFSFNSVQSALGRAGVRIGTTLAPGNIVWTPFVAANVWNEFAGASGSNFACAAPCPGFTLSTSRVGTFGQYGVGVAATVPNTGWVGYARLDYRDGANIQGWGVNAGLRYQFSASEVPKPIVRKSK